MDNLVSERKTSILNRSAALFDGLGGDVVARMLLTSSDIVLVLSEDGIVTDAAYRDASLSPFGIEAWVGRPWADTVTPESIEKIEALYTESTKSFWTRRRQMNHPAADHDDLPVDYALVSIDGSRAKLAIGTDLRQLAQVQSQIVRLQLELETEYRRIRDAQSRYRMIFNMSDTPMAVVDGDGLVIDANQAVAALMERDLKRLVGSNISASVDRGERAALLNALKRAHYGGEAERLETLLAGSAARRHLVIEPFRDGGRNNLLVSFAERTSNGEHRAPHPEGGRWLECVPESLVVISPEGEIEDVNDAFLDLVKVLNRERLIGRNLRNWLGASSIDMQVLMSHVRETGEIRRFSSLVRDEMGGTLPVIVSATRYAANGHEGSIGVLLAEAPRRETPVFVQTTSGGAEGSADFSDLVGRVPLKELVRDAVDVIEKMCIEAALNQTGNNRASAADLLGLSRQSLYIKLRRHGMQDSDKDESD